MMPAKNSGKKDDELPLKNEEDESLADLAQDAPIEPSEVPTIGKDHLYYRNLLEEGYTEAEAQRHTLSYYPHFDPLGSALPDPLPPADWVEPNGPSLLDNTTQRIQGAVNNFKKNRGTYWESIVAVNRNVTNRVFASLESNRKQYILGFSILAIVALGFLSTTLIQPAHPLEGRWISADGQAWIIDADGSWSSSGARSAVWEIDGNQVQVSGYTYGNQPIEQTMRMAVTEDGNGIWMKWTALSLDGVALADEDLPQKCALLLNSNVDNAASNHYVAAMEYSIAAPSWC
tara:strand:+ start:5766 stop:6629 length:864 start_codon:yes stop_codon:yes gene_type:complete